MKRAFDLKLMILGVCCISAAQTLSCISINLAYMVLAFGFLFAIIGLFAQDDNGKKEKEKKEEEHIE